MVYSRFLVDGNSLPIRPRRPYGGVTPPEPAKLAPRWGRLIHALGSQTLGMAGILGFVIALWTVPVLPWGSHGPKPL